MLRSLVLAFSLALSANAAAATWQLRPDASPVTFVATGKPGFLKIRGEKGKASGTATHDGGKLTGTFDVALDALETGIDLRDEHMKTKYLETGKFPAARLTLDPLAVDAANGAEGVPFTGKLTLKGVERPVAGTLSVAFAGDKATGKATFPVKLSDYPVGVPSHLGVTVAETVEVQVTVAAEKAAEVAAKTP